MKENDRENDSNEQEDLIDCSWERITPPINSFTDEGTKCGILQ